MIPVKCRTANDCGVACLATVAGMPWEAAVALLWKGEPTPVTYFGVTREYMYKACRLLGWRVSPEHGSNELIGSRGFMFVRTEREFDTGRHWLAWERNESGTVIVWDPSAAELFEYKPGALHNRGMRLTSWVSITPIKRRK